VVIFLAGNLAKPSELSHNSRTVSTQKLSWLQNAGTLYLWLSFIARNESVREELRTADAPDEVCSRKSSDRDAMVGSCRDCSRPGEGVRQQLPKMQIPVRSHFFPSGHSWIPAEVTVKTIRVPPLIPNLRRSAAGIVTRPRVENRAAQDLFVRFTFRKARIKSSAVKIDERHRG
jgi:hypothetical protein